jgi:hypothetical protein
MRRGYDAGQQVTYRKVVIMSLTPEPVYLDDKAPDYGELFLAQMTHRCVDNTQHKYK